MVVEELVLVDDDVLVDEDVLVELEEVVELLDVVELLVSVDDDVVVEELLRQCNILFITVNPATGAGLPHVLCNGAYRSKAFHIEGVIPVGMTPQVQSSGLLKSHNFIRDVNRLSK